MSGEDDTLPDGARLTPAPPESKMPGDKGALESISERIACLPEILATVNETLKALQEIKVHDAAKFERLEKDLRSLCEAVKELKRDNAADLARFNDLDLRIKSLEERLSKLELLTNQ